MSEKALKICQLSIHVTEGFFGMWDFGCQNRASPRETGWIGYLVLDLIFALQLFLSLLNGETWNKKQIYFETQ